MNQKLKSVLCVLMVNCLFWMTACSDNEPSQRLQLEKPLSNSPTAASQKAAKIARQAEKRRARQSQQGE